MRPIEFRGKLRSSKKWSYGSFANCVYDRFECFVENAIIDDKGCVHEIDPATLGQFTGLTDRNGTKIWEGDILKGFDGVGDYHVRHNGLEYELWHNKMGFKWGYLSRGIEVFELYAHKVEVIGNIHDNHELLKEVQP